MGRHGRSFLKQVGILVWGWGAAENRKEMEPPVVPKAGSEGNKGV